MRLPYSALTDGAATLETYAYLGYDTIVKATRPIGAGDEIGLNYLQLSGEAASDSGDAYTGFDMFGRVIDQRWVRTNSSNQLVATLDRFKYGYDKNGNRLYRDNAQGGGSYNSYDELYHQSGAQYGYDNLDRLTNFERGTLNASNDTISSATRTQQWTLSALGNWDSLTQTGGGNNETRTHDKQNRLTQIVGGSTINISYDGNGNALSDGAGRTLTYDAWNRLAASTHTNNEVRHEYDALGRRIEEVFEDFQINSIVTPTDLYYATDLSSASREWQLIEERSGGTTTQYVWSQRYIDAPVLRDRGSERLFVQGDANFNVTALVNTSGSVVERYVYDPYGTRTAKTATWGARQANGIYNFKPGHQGGRLDFNTKLYHFGRRDLGPALGRWVQQDPIRYPDGMNLYQYVRSAPVDHRDPLGLMDKEDAVMIGATVGGLVGGLIGIAIGPEGAVMGGITGKELGGAVGGAAGALVGYFGTKYGICGQPAAPPPETPDTSYDGHGMWRSATIYPSCSFRDFKDGWMLVDPADGPPYWVDPDGNRHPADPKYGH